MNSLAQRFVAVALVVTAAAGGGYLYGRRTLPSGAGPAGQAEQFTCSMHPFVVTSRPGNCSVCGMELVKRGAGADLSRRDLRRLEHVAPSPSQQVLANLATATVESRPFKRDVSATGIVTYNQARQGKVTAWIAGRLDRLLVATVGAPVAKDRPVAEVYSADLVNAQEEYLLAYNAIRMFNNSPPSSYLHNSEQSLFAARQRLRLLGFREHQFEELQKSGQPTIRAVFLPREVQAGARSGDMIQILAGLGKGENVVATGSYLLDSEAQLSRAAGMASPPRAGDALDMGDVKREAHP